MLQIPRERDLPGTAALAALRLERSALASGNDALLVAVAQEAPLPSREGTLKKTEHGEPPALPPVKSAVTIPMACALASPPLQSSLATTAGL